MLYFDEAKYDEKSTESKINLAFWELNWGLGNSSIIELEILRDVRIKFFQH